MQQLLLLAGGAESAKNKGGILFQTSRCCVNAVRAAGRLALIPAGLTTAWDESYENGTAALSKAALGGTVMRSNPPMTWLSLAAFVSQPTCGPG